MLINPTNKRVLDSVLWKEIRRSDFLFLEENIRSSKYRIGLCHNEFIVAYAESERELDDLWDKCYRISELVSKI